MDHQSFEKKKMKTEKVVVFSKDSLFEESMFWIIFFTTWMWHIPNFMTHTLMDIFVISFNKNRLKRRCCLRQKESAPGQIDPDSQCSLWISVFPKDGTSFRNLNALPWEKQVAACVSITNRLRSSFNDAARLWIVIQRLGLRSILPFTKVQKCADARYLSPGMTLESFTKRREKKSNKNKSVSLSFAENLTQVLESQSRG